MRRKPLLIAVTAAVALAGAGVAGVASASSSTASITFTTLGRTGAKVASHITLVSSPNNTQQYTLGTGKAYTIAKGTYAMLTDIYNPADGTDTMAARLVTVSGTTSVTFDARQGKPVHVSMTGVPAGYTQEFSNVRVCNDPTGFSWVDAYSTPGNLFVIPNSAKQLQFTFLSKWSDPADSSAPEYVALGSIASLPSKPNWAFHGSATAKVRMAALSGPQGGTSASMALQPQGDTCARDLYAQLSNDTPPYSRTVYVTPATWDLRVDETADNGDVIGNFDSVRKVVAGQSYTQYYFRPAWGPAAVVPIVYAKQLMFNTDFMFKDPGFASQLAGEASEKSTATLKLKSTTLTTKHLSNWADNDPNFVYRLSKAGWYSLTVDATRYRPGIHYPSGMLSTKASVTYNFHADPAVTAVAPLWTTRFAPLGLSSGSVAPAGTVTTVDLFFDRASGTDDLRTTPAATLHTITAQASYDEGKTWHSVSLKKSGSTWTALVTNPGTAGSVSLRATTTEKATGANATTTVIRAYTVG
jgi:hypothetical protein